MPSKVTRVKVGPGRKYLLSDAQCAYMRAIGENRDGLPRGWGGYDRTLVVRALEGMGLVRLTVHAPGRGNRADVWLATLTRNGEDVYRMLREMDR